MNIRFLKTLLPPLLYYVCIYMGATETKYKVLKKHKIINTQKMLAP